MSDKKPTVESTEVNIKRKVCYIGEHCSYTCSSLYMVPETFKDRCRCKLSGCGVFLEDEKTKEGFVGRPRRTRECLNLVAEAKETEE
jgi:hypothetical protein